MNEPAIYDTLDFLQSLRESNDIKIWSRMLEKTAAAVSADAGTYYFFDTLSRQLVPFYRLGSAPGTDSGPVTAGEGLCGWVSKFREPLMAEDAAKDKRYKKEADGPLAGSLLCIPLLVNLDFVGVLSFYAKEKNAFTETHLRLAAAAAAQTSLTIRRLRLEDMVNRVTTYNSSILENLSGGFLAVDLQGRVMICNPAARRILGISGEVTDMPVESALHTISGLAAVLRKTLSTRQVVKRQDMPWELNGKKRLLGYSTLLIQDTQGNTTGAGVTFQDITPA
jgi:PAS domain S-box-containing protein